MKQHNTTILGVTLALMLAGPAAAMAQQREHSLVLVGTVPATGQALLWVGAEPAYVMARVGDTVRGHKLLRLLSDRVVLSRRDELTTLRLAASPVGQGQAEAGVPAGILVGDRRKEASRPVVVEPVAMTLPAPPISSEVQDAYLAPRPADPSAGQTTAPRSTSAAAEAATGATDRLKDKQVRAPAPEKSARPRVVSLRLVRGEVSRYLEGSAPYRGVFTDSGLLQISGVEARTLLRHLGLRDGDRIESVGGRRLSTTESAMDAYLDLYTQRSVEVVFWRGGGKQKLEFHLAS